MEKRSLRSEKYFFCVCSILEVLLGICFYIHYMAISTVPIFCVHVAGQLRTLSKLAEAIGPKDSDMRNEALIKHHIGIIRQVQKSIVQHL